MILGDRIARFITEERPVGIMLDDTTVMAQAVIAVTFYDGYADIISNPSVIDDSVDLNSSEWALIKPLFLLYIERETALMLEASRGMGVEVFGRASSEVIMDITAAEQAMPKDAFYFPITTI